MGLLSIIFVAISLSMDSFSVSLAAGMSKQPYEKYNFYFFPFCLALFQSGLFSLGWFLGFRFIYYIEALDHWVAFGLLLIIGSMMITNSYKKDNQDKKFNPFSLINIFTLSVGTSIDALAIGIAFVCAKEKLLLPGIAICLSTYIFSLSGLIIGKFLGKNIKFPFDVVGGIILIIIGIKILFTHLGIFF